MGLFFGQRFSSKFKQTDFEKQACKIKKAIFKSKKPQSIRYLPHSNKQCPSAFKEKRREGL
jgi:hypothetical protein